MCRFRTCICEQGPNCNRPICFFAHCEEERRPLPEGCSDPSTLPLNTPTTRGSSHTSSDNGSSRNGRQPRPATAAMLIPSMDPSPAFAYTPDQALQTAPMMVQQAHAQWSAGQAAARIHAAPMQVVIQQQGAAAQAGGVAALSTSPALSATSNVSYHSLNAMRSHSASPQLVHQGSGQIMWPESQLVMHQPGEEGDAILSFSLWDGEQAHAAAAMQQQQLQALHHQQQLQQLQQQQLQLQQQQQQLQQLQQQQQQAAQTSPATSMFAGFESWSPMHSPLASPHAGRSNSATTAAALSAATLTKQGSARGIAAMAAAAAAGAAPPGSPIAAPALSPASSGGSGSRQQAAVVNPSPLGGVRTTALPRHASGTALSQQELAALVRSASGSMRSGTSTPQEAAAAAEAASQGGAVLAAQVLLQHGLRVSSSSVEALAQDLSTLLSASGLRALSAKLASMADQAEQAGTPADPAQGAPGTPTSSK